jgi:hypothetical protein
MHPAFIHGSTLIAGLALKAKVLYEHLITSSYVTRGWDSMRIFKDSAAHSSVPTPCQDRTV